MSVLADGFNVIARLDSLDSRYPGGRQTYKTDCPNRSYCADDNVCRVGFMIASEALEWVDEIEVKGLTIEQEGEFIDVALVDSMNGIFGSCAWIEVERDSNQILWAGLKGDANRNKVAHEGFGGEKMSFVAAKDILGVKLLKEKQWWQFWK